MFLFLSTPWSKRGKQPVTVLSKKMWVWQCQEMAVNQSQCSMKIWGMTQSEVMSLDFLFSLLLGTMEGAASPVSQSQGSLRTHGYDDVKKRLSANRGAVRHLTKWQLLATKWWQSVVKWKPKQNSCPCVCRGRFY